MEAPFSAEADHRPAVVQRVIGIDQIIANGIELFTDKLLGMLRAECEDETLASVDLLHIAGIEQRHSGIERVANLSNTVENFRGDLDVLRIRAVAIVSEIKNAGDLL